MDELYHELSEFFESYAVLQELMGTEGVRITSFSNQVKVIHFDSLPTKIKFTFFKGTLRHSVYLQHGEKSQFIDSVSDYLKTFNGDIIANESDKEKDIEYQFMYFVFTDLEKFKEYYDQVLKPNL